MSILRHHRHITSLARRRTTCSTWTFAIHTRQSYPRTLLRGILGSRSSKPRPRRALSHIPATIVRQSHLRPVSEAHLPFYIRLLRYFTYQNHCQPATAPRAADVLWNCRRELRRIRILQRGKRVDFEPTRMHYLIFYSAMDFGCSLESACV